MMRNRLKYWYMTYIQICVLCGVERRWRKRVYKEEEKGTVQEDCACHEHF